MTDEEKLKRLRYLQLKSKQSQSFGDSGISFLPPTISGSPAPNPEKLSTFLPSLATSSTLPVVGGIAGGIAGGIPGAALGGAGGEAYRQLLARQQNLPTPQTSMEAAKDIGIEGLTQGVGEAIGSKVITPAVKGAAKLVEKPLGDIFQLITKMRPEDAKTLFNNPSAILPGRWKKAQAGWKAAAEEIGLPTDDVSPEMIDILKGDAKQMVFETYSKLQAGEPVSAKEAQLAKQALDIAVMPVAKTVRKNPIVNTLNQIRSAFIERIGQESPNMAAANKEYAIAATGKKFRSFFPRNTTGDPAYFRSSILPSVIAGAGAARGEPGEGALQAAGLAALSSPLAIGAGLSMAGAGRFGVPYVRRAATASLAELLKEELERQ